MEKPWYKRVKVLVGISTVVLAVIGKFLGPEWTDIVKLIFTVGIAILAGHTVTDIAAMFKR